MFDHVTLRVPDLAAATTVFAVVLDELEIEQTRSTARLSAWGNFVLEQTDLERPIARRVHVAFIAPTTAHVDRFGETGIDAGFADDGPPGSRPDYAHDYYAAFLNTAILAAHGATLAASHSVYVSQSAAVAAIIEKAASAT